MLVSQVTVFHTESAFQLFEAVIRVWESLPSGHKIMEDSQKPTGDVKVKDYDGKSLHWLMTWPCDSSLTLKHSERSSAFFHLKTAAVPCRGWSLLAEFQTCG